ncbi:uncharacterized protein LOC131601389 isoform X2 [Vicia villosa]|uniref:uncharacterized protein LOC131601389 isoform X2 n=1 Tax=Vicia villosa TaxID=3911 RepID=UPI00273C20C7|nr:uncharacterized protein LOC131601389 isoform X2 [Vicia villosa]
MDLGRCDHLHYIQTVKGGLVTKVLNVFRGRPKLSFRSLADIHERESLMVDNDDGKAERVCIDVIEEGIVKTEPDVLVCDADDGDAQGIHDLGDDDDDDDGDFSIFTLKQLKKSCKSRKRKRSHGLNSSRIKINPSTVEDYTERQMEEDDPDLMETLSSLRMKLSKNMKTKKKKKSLKDLPKSSREIVPVEQSEEILDCQEFLPSSGDSAAHVEVKVEPNVCFDGSDDCSGRESKGDHPISSQVFVLVDEFEEVLDGQEFSPSSGDSVALVEVNSECPENDCYGGPDYLSGKERKEDHSMSSQEIVLVDKSEDIQGSQKFSPSNGDSAVIVDVNHESPEDDCFDGPDTCTESKQDAEIPFEWNLQNELNYKWKNFFESIPVGVVKPSSMDNVRSNSELSSNQVTNFPAIEFEAHGLEVRDDTAGAEVQDKPCSTIEHGLNPDGYLVCHSDDSPEYESKQSFGSVCEDDTGTLVSSPKMTSHKDLDCAGLGLRDDNTLLNNCNKNEYSARAEDQDKLCSTTEHVLNPDDCLILPSDDSPEYEEKQSFVSLCDGEPEYEEKQSFVSLCDGDKIHVDEATDELTSCDDHEGSKLHGPERLLSTRKAISPTSQEKLCKAMDSIDIRRTNNLKCKGVLQFTEQTDKNGDAKGLNDITRTAVTNNPNKTGVTPKTSKSGISLKAVPKIRNSSRSATHLGCSTLQNCSKSAISFSKQQMHDAESLAMKLTKELKSMKDIVDDMLRSEFCLNTSLRYKVNEARMAVKSATKAEEGAKRWLSFMSRDCNRFCKIMKLSDSSSSTPQDLVSPPPEVVRKEKKIAFADEAGGKLCQVRIYEDDEEHLPESK